MSSPIHLQFKINFEFQFSSYPSSGSMPPLRPPSPGIASSPPLLPSAGPDLTNCEGLNSAFSSRVKTVIPPLPVPICSTAQGGRQPAILRQQKKKMKLLSSNRCKTFLQTSLVLMGEIGGNDYNRAFFGGKNEEEVALFIPQVVKAIGVTIEELIKLGATTLMVPGNFPIGCSAYYLTYFEHYEEKYIRDPNTGCINWLNMFSEYHNSLLQMELERIRQIHTHTTIIYADYYNAAMSIYLSPEKYGFTKGTLTACCGGEGPFNVSFTVHCGDSGSTTCEDPSKYVSWDGLHLTEAAYKWITRGLVDGPYTSPQLMTANCASGFKSRGFSDH